MQEFLPKASFSPLSHISPSSSRLKPSLSGIESGLISPSSGLSSRRSSQVSCSSSGGFSRSARASITAATFDHGVQQQQHHQQQAAVLEGSVQIVGAIDTGEHSQVIDVTYSENGSVLIAGFANGLIKTFQPSSGNLTSTLDLVAQPLSRLRCKPYQDAQANSLLAATYVSGSLAVWNFSTGNCIAQVFSAKSICSYDQDLIIETTSNLIIIVIYILA